MSNWSELAKWMGVMEAYARSLQTYMADIRARLPGSTGPAGRRRAAWEKAIRSAETGMAAAAELVAPLQAGEDGEGGGPRARRLFLFVGLLDEAGAELARAGAAALDPDVFQEAASAMSQTFSEGLARLARAAGEQGDLAAAARDAGIVAAAGLAPWLAGPSGGPEGLAEVAAEYRGAAAERNSAAAAIYAEVLRIYREQGVDIAAEVEAAKAGALGLGPPQRAGRREGHPLQTMGITFGLTPSAPPAPGAPPPGARIIDATLPQATAAVSYALAPLVDPRAAAAGGRIPTRIAGLSYPAVARFRTIVRRPISDSSLQSSAQGPARKGAEGAEGPLYRTDDRGATFARLERWAGGAPLPADTALEPQPRIDRLGALFEEAFGHRPGAVLAAPDQARQDLAARQAADARERPLLLPAETLRRALERRFLVASEPEGLKKNTRRGGGGGAAGFLAAIGGDGAAPPVYVEEAVAELYAQAAPLREARQAGGRGLFAPGGASAIARAARLEALLTYAVQRKTTTEGVAVRLRRASVRYAATRYRPALDAPFEPQAAPEGAPKGAGLARAAARRLLIQKIFRAVAVDAVPDPRGARGDSRAVEKGTPVEPPLTLKEYLMEHGAETSSAGLRAEGFAAAGGSWARPGRPVKGKAREATSKVRPDNG